MNSARSELWSAAAGDPDARVAVLVHGSMDRSAGLLRLSRQLDHAFRVVRYDRRGYGKSSNAAGPANVAEHVEDLAEVVRSASPEFGAALVFGHSFGGDLALALADRHPSLVSAVGVYEAPLAWLDWWPGTSAGGAAMSAGDSGDAAEAFMRRLVGDRTWEGLPPRKQLARRAEGKAMVAELADLRAGPPWRADRVAVPVLAMRGELTKSHHRRAMTELSETLADCRTATVPGAGHAGPNSHARLVAEELIEFVG